MVSLSILSGLITSGQLWPPWDALRMRSYCSDHIQRGSGPHVTTVFQQHVRTCVLGYTEEQLAQLSASLKHEETSTMGGSKHNVPRLPYKLSDLKLLHEEKLNQRLQLMAMTNSKSVESSCRFGFKCNAWSYFFPCKKVSVCWGINEPACLLRVSWKLFKNCFNWFHHLH